MRDWYTNDRVVEFVYILLRDHLTAGTIEEVMNRLEALPKRETTLTNGFIGCYAENIARRLRCEI